MVNRPQTAVASRRPPADMPACGVTSSMQPMGSDAPLSASLRKGQSSSFDRAPITAGSTWSGADKRDSTGVVGLLRPQSAAPMLNKLRRPGTAVGSRAQLPEAVQRTSSGSATSGSTSNRSSSTAGSGDGHDSPPHDEPLWTSVGRSRVGGVGGHQRPCTASPSSALSRRLSSALQPQLGEEEGSRVEEIDAAALRRRLRDTQDEVTRISNERDLLRATLLQASRDKGHGLMKLGQPVVMAKKDPPPLSRPPSALVPTQPGPIGTCEDCQARRDLVAATQEELAAAHQRCADLARQLAKNELKSLDAEPGASDEALLEQALAEVKLKTKRVDILEDLQEQKRDLQRQVEAQRVLAKAAADGAEKERMRADAAAAALASSEELRQGAGTATAPVMPASCQHCDAVQACPAEVQCEQEHCAAEMQELRADVEALEKSVANLMRDLGTARDETACLQQARTRLEAEVETLRSSLLSERRLVPDLEARVGELQNKLHAHTVLAEEGGEARAALATMKREKQALAEQIHALAKQLADATEAAQRELAVAAAAERRELEDSEARALAAERALLEREAAFLAAEAERDALQADVAALRTEMSDMHTKLAEGNSTAHAAVEETRRLHAETVEQLQCAEARAQESEQAARDAEGKAAAALRLVTRLELKLVQGEGEREDARAIENAYKIRLKGLFDQRLAEVETMQREKSAALEEEYRLKMLEAVATRSAAEEVRSEHAAWRDSGASANSVKARASSAVASLAASQRIRPQTGIHRGAGGGGRVLERGAGGRPGAEYASNFFANQHGGRAKLQADSLPTADAPMRRLPAGGVAGRQALSRPQTSSGVRRLG